MDQLVNFEKVRVMHVVEVYILDLESFGLCELDAVFLVVHELVVNHASDFSRKIEKSRWLARNCVPHDEREGVSRQKVACGRNGTVAM